MMQGKNFSKSYHGLQYLIARLTKTSCNARRIVPSSQKVSDRNRPPPPRYYHPKPGQFVLNVDRSYKELEGIGGVGGVLRDHNGTVLMLLSRHLETLDPKETSSSMELKALMVGLEETEKFFRKNRWHLNRLEVRSDCSYVMDELRHNEEKDKGTILEPICKRINKYRKDISPLIVLSREVETELLIILQKCSITSPAVV
ncbi:hypothetical protein TSUD_62030 [Trifolium subterraneum]|uniref:RNase H type-1 domain-containing protein n=1 Tax=Trifolium subterraneum TaxID=3900 RepID=A0A2Z6MWB9_TRISU|nr:hypothetical protein TSUD_62030 [Trifolium subterraneum]